MERHNKQHIISKERRKAIAIMVILLALCNGLAAQVPANVPTSGLVAYYGFDGNANDQSGNNNHGTLQCDAGASIPTPTSDRFGTSNRAYLFGGVDNRNWIKVSNSGSLHFNQRMSISFWMKQTSARGQAFDNITGQGTTVAVDARFTIIGKGGDNQPGGDQATPVASGICIENSLSGSNVQHFTYLNTNSTNVNYTVRLLSSYNCYQMSQWIHVVYTIAPGQCRIYINGTLYNEQTDFTPDFSVANTMDLYFGRRGGGDETWFPYSGALDDIAIYNRVLDNSEVLSLYNNYHDPLDNNGISVSSVAVMNPCGTNSGTITINARPQSGVTYSYALGNSSNIQSSNVLQAGPGTHHCYVVSPCAIWDTTITLQCDCSTDPTMVSYDSICPGENGVRGSINVVADYNFNNGTQGWTASGQHVTHASGEDNYSTFVYAHDCDDYYYLYIYPGTCVSYPYDCSCRPITFSSPQDHAHTGRAWFFGTYYGTIGQRFSGTVTSPAVNVPCDPTRATISFWPWCEGIADDLGFSGHNTMTLSYSTSPNGSYTQLWSSGGRDIESWSQVNVGLSSLPAAGTYYFRFTNSGNGYVSIIDDITLTCDNRRAIPVEVTSAAAGSTVRVDTPISSGDANSCPITQTTYWYVKPTSSSTEEVTVPPPSYTWHGSTYSANGTYSWNNGGRLKNALGCDSTVYLNLTLDINNKARLYIDTCDSYTWPANGRTFTSSNTDSVKCRACNQWGGDSTTYLHLTIHYSTARDSTVMSCYPIIWQGETYEDSFTDMVHLYTATGHCDSLVTLIFTRHYDDEFFLVDSMCEDEVYHFAGSNITAEDVRLEDVPIYTRDFTARMRNRFLCDSTVHLNLTVFPNYSWSFSDSVDQADLPYTAYNQYSGEDYSYELRNERIRYYALGNCDSSYYLTLVIRYQFFECDLHLQFPNLITPNGDGHNDRFYIRGLENGCFPDNELVIYNRWGARVFSARNIENGMDCWEPTHMPAGTYYYRFKGHNLLGTVERFGVVEVIKK